MKTDKPVSEFAKLLIFYNIMFFVALVMLVLGICLSHNRNDSLARLGAVYFGFGFITSVVGFFFFIFDVLVKMFRQRNSKDAKGG